MGSKSFSYGKSLFLFVIGLPYRFFLAAHFLVHLQSRWRRSCEYRSATKSISFLRLSNEEMTLAQVIRAIGARNAHHASALEKRPPLMFDLFEGLWEEGMTEQWKIPNISELCMIEDALRADLRSFCGARSRVWVIDDASGLVAYDLLRGANITPIEDLVMMPHRGGAMERCYGYAVRVCPLKKKDETP